MFKLTIASSGKDLALRQIKPIGLHDGHLVGGEDSDFDSKNIYIRIFIYIFLLLLLLLEVPLLAIFGISQ